MVDVPSDSIVSNTGGQEESGAGGAHGIVVYTFWQGNRVVTSPPCVLGDEGLSWHGGDFGGPSLGMAFFSRIFS